MCAWYVQLYYMGSLKDAFQSFSNLRCKMVGWGFEFLILKLV